MKDETATVLWRDPPANRPEQTLVGVQYTAHLQNDGQGAMYVVQTAPTGSGAARVHQRHPVPGILGYESDRLMSEYPSPPGTNYHLVQISGVDAAGRIDSANTSVYQAPSGAWVFASGTHHWSLGWASLA